MISQFVHVPYFNLEDVLTVPHAVAYTVKVPEAHPRVQISPVNVTAKHFPIHLHPHPTTPLKHHYNSHGSFEISRTKISMERRIFLTKQHSNPLREIFAK